MSTVRAYYDGLSFVPIEPVNVQKGKVVRLSILLEESANKRIAERLAAFRKLTDEINTLNRTEALPPEYDEILQARVNFARELDL
jgi:predicted DNA-binding antitoxin AbrB/MazE fold protein